MGVSSRYGLAGLLCLTVLLFMPAAASADSVTYDFTNITGNSVTDAAIGEAQMSVVVSDAGLDENNARHVAFTFRNSGPEASVITAVYFQDGTLLSLDPIPTTDDVSFTLFKKDEHEKLAGWQEIDFVTHAGFAADATKPAPFNGVNPGEELTVTFTLMSGSNFADTIAALNAALNGWSDGGLRIGIKVQGYESGGSESFINGPPVVVPLPGVAWAGMALFGGLSVVGGLKKLRQRKEAWAH